MLQGNVSMKKKLALQQYNFDFATVRTRTQLSELPLIARSPRNERSPYVVVRKWAMGTLIMPIAGMINAAEPQILQFLVYSTAILNRPEEMIRQVTSPGKYLALSLANSGTLQKLPQVFLEVPHIKSVLNLSK